MVIAEALACGAKNGRVFVSWVELIIFGRSAARGVDF
jgi:hypothetical protein